MRRGSSLLEALLALVLFEFGLLALLAATATSARDLASANRRQRARSIAGNRVEQLRGTACATPAAGAARWQGGVTEIWRVESVGQLRIITDSVVLQLARNVRGAHVERAWSICVS